MKDYSREIRKLIKRIPTDFECEPGCHDCCTIHAWTWTEWNKLPHDMRKCAAKEQDSCPFIADAGCECYEQRPIICRLWGYAGSIGPYGPFTDVNLKCRRGLTSGTTLPRKEARAIFLGLMDVLKSEGRDAMNEGMGPIFAGPYGRWVGERKEFTP